MKQRYCGRFAPSPTGPLHFGSLVAAVGGYCEARARGGDWLVRMEDLDRPREAPGAAADILRTLEACGFLWHGPVMYQSRRTGAYRAAFERLTSAAAVFPCACSRREIADSIQNFGGAPLPDAGRQAGRSGEAPARTPELIYPGTCRNRLPRGRIARAYRVRVGDALIEFEDAIQGNVREDLATGAGDFVLLRADGLFAYQLAVVVDDAEQGVTDVVRGADLLDSTARQIHLQRLLGLPRPSYAHLPVAVNALGQKLSKQTLALPLEADRAPAELVRALQFLGQAPPGALARAGVSEVWAWAGENWRLARVPRLRAITVPG